jgi:hypothetical protein
MRKFTIEQFIALERREEREWARNGYDDDCRIPQLVDAEGNIVDPYEADRNGTYFVIRPIGFLGKRRRTNYARVEKIGYTQPYCQNELEGALKRRFQNLLNMTDKVITMAY